MGKESRNEYGLNITEESFLNEWFVNGFNGQAAYKSIFNSIDSTANVEGSKLLARPHVKAEVARRKEKTAQEVQIKYSEMADTLLNLVNECKTDKDRKNLIKSIDLLNKMAGFYQQKIDITSKNEKVSINFNLDTDEE
ncbi:MAG: terminase small subunit [Bacteroidia bacterium]